MGSISMESTFLPDDHYVGGTAGDTGRHYGTPGLYEAMGVYQSTYGVNNLHLTVVSDTEIVVNGVTYVKKK